MESTNIWCNWSRIVASLSGRVETMKRHNETMKRHDETTKRHNDEAMWSVMSWTRKATNRRGQSTNWTDKMTRRTPEAMSRLLRSASRTRKTTTRLEEWLCRNDETPQRNDESNILSTIYLHRNPHKHDVVRASIALSPSMFLKCGTLFPPFN